jgi:methionine-rich copper-binding protein CopC
MHRFMSVILATALLWSAAGLAHTHLVASSPADHAELATPPKEAILTFAEAVVLTAAKLESMGGAKTVLKPLPAGNVKEAHIPLPTLAAGRYRLQWRAASDDGHVMSGEISFVVIGPAPR